MAYQSYRISEPSINLSGNKPASPDDLKALDANQFGAARKMLASDTYRNTQIVNGLYRPWADVEAELMNDYTVVAVGSSNDFELPVLLEEDQTRFVDEQKLLAELGMFKTYFIVTLRAANGAGETEYVIVGCTDERTFESSADTETYSRQSMRPSYTRDTIFPDKVSGHSAASWLREARNIQPNKPKAYLRADKMRVLSEKPQYCFAISRFTTERMFASDHVVLEPSAVFMPGERKSSRFEVTQTEVDRLPHATGSKRVTYGLAIFYAIVLTMFVVTGGWISAVVFLPIYAASVVINARQTRGTQLTYLKVKHAVLPRKLWQIEE